MISSSSTDLTRIERIRLEQYEKIIERGKQTFIEVGGALMSIRDSRLYRATHDTFEDYCRERWGWSHRHVNRQIQAAEIAGRMGPMGPKPDNERQVRPLAELEPEEQAAAWDEAVKTARPGRVTEKHVRGVVEKRRKLDPERQARVDEFNARMRRRDAEAKETQASNPGESLEDIDDVLRRADAYLKELQEASERFSHLRIAGNADDAMQTSMLDLVRRYILSFEPAARRVEVAHNLIKAIRVLIHEVNDEPKNASA